MKSKAFIFIVLAGILWGTSGIFFAILSPFGFSPLQMTAMRGVVSAIIMSIYTFFANRKLFKVGIKELIMFICSGFSVFLTASTYFAAIKAASVSAAVILMYTAPIFVMSFSVAFLGEKLTLLKGGSVVLVIIGCALVSGVAGGIKLSLSGLLLGLAAGVSYSAYNIFTKISMLRGYNSTTSTVYCFIFMGIASLPFCSPVSFAENTLRAPLVTIPLIIGIGVFTCVLPYFFYTLALRDIPAGTASSLSIIEPMSATLFSVVFLNENLSFYAAIGILLILIAVFLLSKSEK